MTWVYAGSVSPERRYQLQNAEANQQIDALLERLRVPGSRGVSNPSWSPPPSSSSRTARPSPS